MEKLSFQAKKAYFAKHRKSNFAASLRLEVLQSLKMTITSYRLVKPHLWPFAKSKLEQR